MHPAVVWKMHEEFGVLCCLTTPLPSKDIQCHVWPYYFLCLQSPDQEIRPHVTLAVCLVIADG